MKIIKARCHVCNIHHTFVNQELDVVRNKSCKWCKVRLTVISSEEETAPPMPDRERRELTERETNDARRLLLPALDGLEV
jgi:hypothetical protein